MKFLIRSFLTTAAALFIISWTVPGFTISKDLVTFSMLAAGLTVANWFVKPILKIVFLPVNIATFGLFSIVINAAILYAVSYFLPGVHVSEWAFSGFSYQGYIIPRISFGIIETYLLSGLIIGICLTLIKWLVE